MSKGIANAVHVEVVQGVANIVQFTPKHNATGPMSVDVNIIANTAANSLEDTGIVHHKLGSSNCGSVEEFSDFVRRVLLGEFRPS